MVTAQQQQQQHQKHQLCQSGLSLLAAVQQQQQQQILCSVVRRPLYVMTLPTPARAGPGAMRRAMHSIMLVGRSL
jgi:hypothetical protein